MVGLCVPNDLSLEKIIVVESRGSGTCPCMNEGLMKDCAAVAAQKLQIFKYFRLGQELRVTYLLSLEASLSTQRRAHIFIDLSICPL